MKHWPLRWQITAWSGLLTGAVLLTLAVATTVSLYFAEIEDLDDDLTAESDLFFAALPPTASGQSAVLPSDLVHKHSEVLYGFAIGPTDGAAVQVFPAQLATLTTGWPPAPGFRMTALAGQRLRLGVFTKGGRTLLLAASLESTKETLLALLGAYFFALPVALVVVAAGSWWIAGRALRPVAELTRTASTITVDNLGARLPVPATRDEISRHVGVLNEMLDRLQRSFELANRFTADAAHELRTPLTIMRGQIEDALRSGNFNPEQERLLVGLLEENTGLQKIADNLLLLARFDAGKNPLQRTDVDLSALAGETREDAELLAAPQHIKVSAQITPGLRVSGDQVMLRRVALNLIDNAVKFNRAGGELALGLRPNGDAVVFTVGNTGPGIPAERQAALFERFFRPDPGRDGDTGGSGLGLSLCREIITAHGGQISLTRSDAEWTEFSIRLPGGN
jgi:signal transduction histidine kinase